MMYGTTRTASTCLLIRCIVKGRSVLAASVVLWPVGGGRQREFMRWPAYEKMYISAFERMLDVRKAKDLPCDWQTGMDVFRWWMEDDNVNGQLSMDDLMEANNV